MDHNNTSARNNLLAGMAEYPKNKHIHFSFLAGPG